MTHSKEFQRLGYFKEEWHSFLPLKVFCWCLHRSMRSACQIGGFSLGNSEKRQLSSPTAKSRGNAERIENVSTVFRFQWPENISIMMLCVVSLHRKKKKSFRLCCQMEREKWRKHRQKPLHLNLNTLKPLRYVSVDKCCQAIMERVVMI